MCKVGELGCGYTAWRASGLQPHVWTQARPVEELPVTTSSDDLQNYTEFKTLHFGGLCCIAIGSWNRKHRGILTLEMIWYNLHFRRSLWQAELRATLETHSGKKYQDLNQSTFLNELYCPGAGKSVLCPQWVHCKRTHIPRQMVSQQQRWKENI